MQVGFSDKCITLDGPYLFGGLPYGERLGWDKLAEERERAKEEYEDAQKQEAELAALPEKITETEADIASMQEQLEKLTQVRRTASVCACVT